MRGKGVIGQFFQGNPLETNLPAISGQATANRRKITAGAVKDRLNLMETSMNAVHTMIFAHILPEVDQAPGNDLQAEFLKNLPLDGIGQRFAMLLPTAWQDQKLPLIRPDPHNQQVLAP